MIRAIDKFLNSITMYRLILYGLLVLVAVSLIASLTGILSYKPLDLIISAAVLYGSSNAVNYLLAKLYKAPTNVESAGITAFILFFVLAPVGIDNLNGILTLAGCSALAMASKYVLAIGHKHIFNPAALGAFVIGVFGSGAAIWWIGSGVLSIPVAIVGLLIVRKIRRFHLFISFLLSSLIFTVLFNYPTTPLTNILTEAFTSWPVLFFACFMLTEPLTTPPTKHLHTIYGLLVGALFGARFHIGPIYSTPELALILGNIFSYIVSPKQKLILTLKNKVSAASGIYEFIFEPDQKLKFTAGQYLEWTLPHEQSDSRGNRRYFTVASSPTEPQVKLGVRINPEKSSSFKHALLDLNIGDQIVAGALAGDFTLPKDQEQKLVFIAGGIGITPFRSMIRYLVDSGQKRDTTLFYAALIPQDFAYIELFKEAETKVGLKTLYVLTDDKQIPTDWNGLKGFITPEVIKTQVPDFKERLFYLSGPEAMVTNYKKMLKQLGLPQSQIKTDYFPGF